MKQRWWRVLVGLAALCCSALATAAVDARLDRSQIAPGETVQLVLEHDGSTGDQPDLAPLRQDFDILSRSSGSSISIVNGNMSAKMQVQLVLSPRHAGHLRIPPLQWGKDRSPALDLEVGGKPAAATPAAGAGDSPHVFLTGTLDTRQPYVQAAAILTVRLYTDTSLYQPNLDFSPAADVRVQQLGKDSQHSEMRDGRRYQVVERRYLVFPQHSGHIEVAGPVLDAQVADNSGDSPFGDMFGQLAGMMGSTRPLHLRADPVVLDVRPRPAAAAGHDWLPARQVTLTESWRPADGRLHAGEPVTRHLSLSVDGLAAEDLPDLGAALPLPDGLKAYPDQASLTTTEQDGHVVGHREQDVALIAGQPGHYELPAVHLWWWDTAANVAREAVLPARTLDVLPAPGGGVVSPGAAAPAAPVPAAAVVPAPGSPVTRLTGAGFWPWLCLALALLWLATLLAWWRAVRSRRRPEAAVPERAPRPRVSRQALLAACRSGDPQQARQALLAWAQATWPESPPAGMAALARRLGSEELSLLLRELDRACYAGTAWDGGPLWQALQSLPQGRQKQAAAAPGLADLYP
jgi:hypothetical protein